MGVFTHILLRELLQTQTVFCIMRFFQDVENATFRNAWRLACGSDTRRCFFRGQRRYYGYKRRARVMENDCRRHSLLYNDCGRDVF